MDVTEEQVTEETAEETAADEGTEPEGTAEAAAPSRKERRENKLREAREAAAASDDLRRQLAEERAERQRDREQLAELRGRFEATQKQEQPDPHEARLQELRDKAQRHLSASATSQDQATATKELKAYHDTLEDIADVRAERKFAQKGQEWQRQQPDVSVQAQKVALEQEYPWLSSNKEARGTADGYYNILVYGPKKRPQNLATLKEACALAAKEHGLGGTPTASDASKGRYGIPTGQTGGSQNGSPRSLSVETMTSEQKTLAELQYQSLAPEAAHKKWLATSGKKVQQMG